MIWELTKMWFTGVWVIFQKTFCAMIVWSIVLSPLIQGSVWLLIPSLFFIILAPLAYADGTGFIDD